jgi:DNA-binding response OmpR family regulator
LNIYFGTNEFSVSYPAGGLDGSTQWDSEVNDVVKVLVVEDDQLIQAMVEEALSDGGFGSAITASGEEAILLLKSSTSQYRAVVTDINLAGQLDGWEVARAARENDPAMPVIYMTGTHGEEWASKGVPNSVLLAKPFAPAQLVTAIANLLNTVITPPAAPTE